MLGRNLSAKRRQRRSDIANGFMPFQRDESTLAIMALDLFDHSSADDLDPVQVAGQEQAQGADHDTAQIGRLRASSRNTRPSNPQASAIPGFEVYPDSLTIRKRAWQSRKRGFC
jgi:hypothetical protein